MLNTNLTPKSINHIEYVCKLIFESYKLPVLFINSNNAILFNFTYEYLKNPVTSKKDILNELLPFDTLSTIPKIITTKYNENFFCVNLIKEGIYIGTFIAGPSIFAATDISTIDNLIDKNKLSLIYKKPLLHYFSLLKVIDPTRLISISQFLHYSIYNEPLDSITIINNNSTLKNIEVKVENSMQQSLSNNRKNTSLHHSQLREQNILKCVTNGNIEKLLQYLEVPLDGDMGVLSKNNLRNHKNLAICFTTIITRASIEGGLNSELAFTLSDSYIQLIEESSSLIDIDSLLNTMAIKFTEKVRKAKTQTYSKPIAICLSYILKNLYEDISVVQLSTLVNLNQNYLSTLFKKEVGITISQYIHKERIYESKQLLTSTNHTILEISILLKFHDQSHFTRVFKEITGMSPKKYRNEHFKL